MPEVRAPAGPGRSDARALGWLSGLGLVVVPWVAAGVLSTGLGLLGGDGGNPETTFPWLLLGALALMVLWIGYGAIRIPGFRRGALLGSAIAVGATACLLGLLLALQP